MCENYKAMQKNLSQLMNTNFEKDPTQSRKRKPESENWINMFGSIRDCNTIIEDESLKRSMDITTPKVSKVLVKTEASNNSLVSFSLCFDV